LFRTKLRGVLEGLLGWGFCIFRLSEKADQFFDHDGIGVVEYEGGWNLIESFKLLVELLPSVRTFLRSA